MAIVPERLDTESNQIWGIPAWLPVFVVLKR